MKLVQTILGGGGGSARLLALAALLGLLAAAALSLAPAAAEGELDQFELVLSLEEDSDNVVPAGSELTVNAVLRFPWQLPITPPADQPSYVPYKLDVPGAGSALSRLRISGNLEWDSAGRQRLELAAQTLIQSDHTGPGSGWSTRAFDGRTIVARPHNDRVLRIHDSYTLAHVATISTPAGAGGNHNSGFGASDARQTGRRGAWIGKAIDVWHETADRAWLFVGSWPDNVDSQPEAGRLHRYRLDWDDEGVTVTPMGALGPPATESRNRHGQTWAWYGAAVAFSRDGSTLAVTAPRMNMMGAVYVYSRPDGPGEDWGDVEYADGVKVSVGEVPSWGVTFGEMPFNPNSASGCDAWCSMVWSSAVLESSHIAGLGSQRVSLSADGRVLVVGNGTKSYAVTTPGGGFGGANQANNAGEAYVWIAPEGGWQSAPLANRDAEGNRRTVFAAKTNATSFRRATHYSPGPLRRWTEPAAVLAPATWPSVGNNQFGREAVVSADGSTVAVGNSFNAVYIFQRDSAGDWASAAGGYLTPDATLSGLWAPDEGPMHFSPDGRELAVSQIPGNAVRVFSRPASGTWVDATGATARLVRVPAGSSSRFGSVIPELSGRRVALANQSSSTDWLTYPILSAANGCTTSTVDGETTASCPLTLPGSTITIPEGTPDGPFVISGNVTLQPNGGDPITLRSTLEVTIGKVKEVDSAALALATDIGDPTTVGDEKPYPSLLRTQGESTRLLLRILNENGTASHAGSVAAVLVSSSAGNLGVLDADLEGDVCAGISCQLDSSEINANNADRLVITLTHAGKAANAEVRATVFSAAGDSFATEPVSIALAGPADSIAVASSTSGVLNVQAAGTDADGSTESDAADLEDARDHLLLAVTATDTAGNSVALPPGARRGQVLDPDGVRVTSGVRVIFPHRGDPTALVSTDNAAITNAAGAQQVRIDVDRAPTNPLASGEYTLEVWVGQKKATRTFIVSGGPVSDGISLSDPGAVTVGESFTVTATFNDASGAAVPNGTEVDWPEIVTASGAGQQVVLTGKDTRTTDGRASATWLAVNSGSVVVTAGYECAESVTSRGDAAVGDCEVSGVRLVRITDAEQAAAAPTSLVDGLSSRNPVNFSSWIGQGSTTAAELLSALDDVNGILIWLDGEWIRYGVADGREIPGSIDFRIAPGAILWLGR